MPTIRKRTTDDGKTHFQVQVRVRGLPQASKTFDGVTKATAWAKKTEAEMKSGLYLPKAEALRHTFAELAKTFVAHRRAMANGKPDAHIEAHLAWWGARLGDYALAEVSPARIATLRDALLSGDSPSGRPVSNATAVRYLSTLGVCFAYAEDELSWVALNPVRKVKKPREAQGRVRYLSKDDELPRLLESCRASRDPKLYPLLVLALCTGARVGELLSLRWRDVDLSRDVAVLHKTKNRDRRGLVLTPPARAALVAFRKVQPIGHDFIFGDSKGRRRFPQKAWETARDAAGLSDFRWHDLRHTAASYLLMSGATLAEVAAMLGHRTLAMVARYGHIAPDHLRAVTTRMSEAFLDGALLPARGAS